uniref:F-box domain-containing protein n=1 Tax=Globisporangium ultimum (strain ATCC 200006 / CBS 805.95 / DAOM BR144) TaxID=431595 RepID=K3WER9_GLOUD
MASLDAPIPLLLISAFLTLQELCQVRAVSRSCFTVLPNHTHTLVGTNLRDHKSVVLATNYFPRVTTLVLQDCKLSDGELTLAIECIGSQWSQLQAVKLSRVQNLKDHHVRQLAETCSALEMLTVSQCYQVQKPLVVALKLRYIEFHGCFFSRFAMGTRLPALQELRMLSRVLTTLNVHKLIKEILVKEAPLLETLCLANCGEIEQVLIDPMELPKLRTLDLSNCHALTRVHVSSPSLTTLHLSFCLHLEHLILDLQSVRIVDLSFLQSLTHLYLRSDSLKALNLTGCNQLERANLQVMCPALKIVLLQGTNLSLGDGSNFSNGA